MSDWIYNKVRTTGQLCPAVHNIKNIGVYVTTYKSCKLKQNWINLNLVA